MNPYVIQIVSFSGEHQVSAEVVATSSNFHDCIKWCGENIEMLNDRILHKSFHVLEHNNTIARINV